ncbi:ABC-type polysaccharide/polyol phosphate export system, permease component [Methanocella conradii HZ254]|uniref:ABC-type polysaccharide/polyol phosphate export system, permease component n=1 Tax=Methanocella conradii (strain DSM 24694 / JCM 17849 / CGMCC 1.5162 / HZ254) TaxID=1041930 RepID=H8I8Y1_METCZ|nr:ABC transporter permease [Methanocella conradii]AFD00452.1 ABC-type polysaccharide/polyol phosphate export system, permease component [Methanocella conradii HZ254]MDI6895731.1 ABC transporter permease [Methanocella conradii]
MSEVFYYFYRDLLKWLRGKIFVVTALVMPAAWLIFVGLALPTRFTDNYLEFITPGILVMTMLFSSLQGGSLLIFDKILGFLNKFMALPARRESILFGKISFITFRGILQSMVILGLAVIFGVSLPGPIGFLYMLVVLAVFGILFSSLASAIALIVDDHDGYAAVNSMISMPLYFASSALMPYSSMPEWLRVIASINPVSFAIDTIRADFNGQIVYTQLIVITAMAVAVLLVSIYMFRKATI